MQNSVLTYGSTPWIPGASLKANLHAYMLLAALHVHMLSDALTIEPN
jgi:hypothetical protein